MAVPTGKYVHITTDDTLRETVSHGSGSYPFAYYPEDVAEFDFSCIDWHWHYELEFITVMEGALRCLIGEDRIELPAGFGLFVNSGILHRYEGIGESVFTPNIVFSPVLMGTEESLIFQKYVFPIINSNTAYQIFNPQTEWQNIILQILDEIYHLQESGKERELQTVELILKMWNILFEHVDTASETANIRQANHRQAKLQMMMQFIHDHYSEQITLEEIAATAAVSKSSALNLFQTGIHMSPVAYLIQYRLKCAGKLLHTTEKPVSVIAEETGFSTANYFCRKFKAHYGMSPNAYRKN